MSSPHLVQRTTPASTSGAQRLRRARWARSRRLGMTAASPLRLSTPRHKLSLCLWPLKRPCGVGKYETAFTSSVGHRAGPPLPQLWRRSARWLTRAVPPLRPTATVGFLAPRAQPLRLAAAEASGEAPRRKPLRALRLQRAALRPPRGARVKRARGSRHALLALPCKRTCAHIIPARRPPFLEGERATPSAEGAASFARKCAGVER
jgi:hypothetical protein